MAECGNCSQEKPTKKKYHFYTAIMRKSTIKTGFKEYETITQFFHFKDHKYSICADCIRRYGVFSLVLWLPACFVITPLIMWLLYSQSEASGNEELLLACTLSPVFTLGLAFLIWFFFLNLKRKMVRKAVAAREATNWRFDLDGLPRPRMHEYTNTDTSHEIRGYTEAEYKILQKKI